MKESAKTPPSKLFITRVLPITKAFKADEATYFSSQQFTVGATIKVPFRTREIHALVLNSSPLSEEKTLVKGADFQLKKIPKTKEQFLLSSDPVRVASILSEMYPITIGEILSLTTPSFLLKNPDETKTNKQPSKKEKKTHTVSYIQKTTLDRIEEYIRIGEEHLSQNKSLVIVTPTQEEAQALSNTLTQTLTRVTELSGRLTQKKQQELWKEIEENTEPQVFVTTPLFASLNLPATTLIIEHYSSHAYYFKSRPFLDAREYIEILCRERGVRLIKTDSYLPLQATDGDIIPALNTLTSKTDLSIIDTTTKESLIKKKFSPLSEEVLQETADYLKAGKNVFWFVARKGLFPQTICRDCGHEHVCNTCDSSLVLHETKDTHERFFLCHRCGLKDTARTLCSFCGSWNLIPLGIGIESVRKEAETHYDSIVTISGDAKETKTQIKKALSPLFEENARGTLIIGTDKILPFLPPTIPLVVVVSIDSRLGIPSYNAEESALTTLINLSSLSEEKYLIQTRRPDHRVFSAVNGENLNSFRKEESDLRKAFSYPPFGTITTLSYSGSKERASKIIHTLKEDIEKILKEDDSITALPLKGTHRKNTYLANLVLKTSNKLDQNKHLFNHLRFLPPDIYIKVNPDTLW